MSNKELTTGDLVYVSDISEEQAKELKIEAIFIAKIDKDFFSAVRGTAARHAGRLLCLLPTSGELDSWRYAVKVPKPKLVPWTFETAPRLPFAIKPVARPAPHEFVVTEKTTDYLYSSSSKITYNSALKHHQWLDGDEWKPCGVIEE